MTASICAELLEGPSDGVEIVFDGWPDPDCGYDGGEVPQVLTMKVDSHGKPLAKPAIYVRASFPEHEGWPFFLHADSVEEYRAHRTAEGQDPGTYAEVPSD